MSSAISGPIKEVESRLVAKGSDELEGFSIAGEDGEYQWAKAKIIGTNQVAVHHPDITTPLSVRYAWANNPACNHYNKKGLPASPFRTDNKIGVTYGNQ